MSQEHGPPKQPRNAESQAPRGEKRGTEGGSESEREQAQRHWSCVEQDEGEGNTGGGSRMVEQAAA
eukprot:13443330-Alexandrium_andersonii.AAC.1